MKTSLIAILGLLPTLGLAHAQTPGYPSGPRQRAMVHIMHSSMRLSGTISQKYTGIQHKRVYPWHKAPKALANQSERNFLTAATLIAKYHNRLPLDIKTADFINRLLNRNTTTKINERVDASHVKWSRQYKATRQTSRDRNNLWWTRTDEGQAMAKSDPVGFAEHFLHFANVIDNGAERYLDANGRTWRLMTDLALLKLGRAPVMYPLLSEYVKATPRSNPSVAEEKLSREGIQQAFRKWAADGQALLGALANTERTRPSMVTFPP